MSTPDPRRGDEPGDGDITPAPGSPQEDDKAPDGGEKSDSGERSASDR